MSVSATSALSRKVSKPLFPTQNMTLSGKVMKMKAFVFLQMLLEPTCSSRKVTMKR